jgi:hypothetical protein
MRGVGWEAHVTSHDATLDAVGTRSVRSGVACPKNVQRQYLTCPSELVQSLREIARWLGFFQCRRDEPALYEGHVEAKAGAFAYVARRGGWPAPGVKIRRAEPYRPLRLGAKSHQNKR